jgi:CheY-like chemotaxis protein
MLEERGIECEEAADGQAGIDLLQADPDFDLAFVDWTGICRS